MGDPVKIRTTHALHCSLCYVPYSMYSICMYVCYMFLDSLFHLFSIVFIPRSLKYLENSQEEFPHGVYRRGVATLYNTCRYSINLCCFVFAVNNDNRKHMLGFFIILLFYINTLYVEPGAFVYL